MMGTIKKYDVRMECKKKLTKKVYKEEAEAKINPEKDDCIGIQTDLTIEYRSKMMK